MTSAAARPARRQRRLSGGHNLPRGCAGGYMSELNVLCAIGDYSTQSDQPIMKNLNVTVERSH